MFLPQTVNMEGIKLIFSTEKDGWSLSTLYAKSEGLYPCLIIVRTLQNDCLVAAFITTTISPPSGEIRGDGNSFVCRLDGPDAACYRWIGKDKNEELQHKFTNNQFGVFSEKNIMIGGSREKGENAIFIDSDLSTCFFGVSDTFGNPQLAPNDSNGRSSLVAGVEVLCGVQSISRAQENTDYGKRLWSDETNNSGNTTGIRNKSILREKIKGAVLNSKSDYGDNYTRLADNEV
jgi:hypothetical protein